MDYKDIIWISLNILIFFVFIFITYRSYIRQKYYSGKKFIWSKRDQENEKLKDYHAYEYPLMSLIFAFQLFSAFIDKYSNLLSTIFRIAFWLLIIYVIVSFIVISKKRV